MSLIFFSGSRSIKKLKEEIRERIIGNVMGRGFCIVIGDAHGADRAFQELFVEYQYPHVQIYCSGRAPRNNLGNWPLKSLNSSKKGRDFYSEKDRQMAAVADYGFVLWDGRSMGSLNNLAELLVRKKSALMYHTPSEKFIKLKTSEELKALIHRDHRPLVNEILSKGNAPLQSLVQPHLALFSID